jgi:hypothetical protein
VGYVGQWLKAWIAALKDRRESERKPLFLVAYYWNGAAPRPYEVKGVSLDGAYIVTSDRWYMGTVLRITFQYGDGSAQGSPSHVARAKLVRFGPDGIGVRLIYLSREERLSFKKFLAGAQSTGGSWGRLAGFQRARCADEKDRATAE